MTAICVCVLTVNVHEKNINRFVKVTDEQQHQKALLRLYNRLRPYHVESTGSRPITEVKQRRARLVLGWVTAWEYRVP